jgi:LmbE family N-acetylglucosaminyl deacetylase
MWPLLYRRTNYKMFLKTTMQDLDERIRHQLCATDMLSSVVRPIPIEAPFGESMLVLAPHHDDEIIGCGGAILLQVRSSRPVHVLFLQDGGDEHAADGMSRAEMIALRENEARSVAAAAGIPEPRFLRWPRLGAPHTEKIAAQIREELERTNAETIFAPFLLDNHPDHRWTNIALSGALKSYPGSLRIYGYEVWGLCVANTALIIDTVMKKKQELLAMYKSQVLGTDYVHCVTGLNMYHSRPFGAGSCRYVENFFEVPAREFVPVVESMYSGYSGA